jgi:hypothetical protein
LLAFNERFNSVKSEAQNNNREAAFQALLAACNAVIDGNGNDHDRVMARRACIEAVQMAEGKYEQPEPEEELRESLFAAWMKQVPPLPEGEEITVRVSVKMETVNWFHLLRVAAAHGDTLEQAISATLNGAAMSDEFMNEQMYPEESMARNYREMCLAAKGKAVAA